jgi:hypothetical protein
MNPPVLSTRGVLFLFFIADYADQGHELCRDFPVREAL